MRELIARLLVVAFVASCLLLPALVAADIPPPDPQCESKAEGTACELGGGEEGECQHGYCMPQCSGKNEGEACGDGGKCASGADGQLECKGQAVEEEACSVAALRGSSAGWPVALGSGFALLCLCLARRRPR